ncbi:hypothetical protein ACEYYH_10705 [Microbacterium trichothecenolyticum]|uniref:hypothetical protein n=1 Tax=Microbacterium trichothecenolyticum TaxID=69370 RepID=UPI0035BE259E
MSGEQNIAQIEDYLGPVRAESTSAMTPRLAPVAQAGIPTAMLREDVVRHVLWQYGLAGAEEPGHFTGALMQAFQRADEGNFRILREAYPVLGFWMYALRFSNEGHALALRALRQMGVRP